VNIGLSNVIIGPEQDEDERESNEPDHHESSKWCHVNNTSFDELNQHAKLLIDLTEEANLKDRLNYDNHIEDNKCKPRFRHLIKILYFSHRWNDDIWILHRVWQSQEEVGYKHKEHKQVNFVLIVWDVI